MKLQCPSGIHFDRDPPPDCPSGCPWGCLEGGFRLARRNPSLSRPGRDRPATPPYQSQPGAISGRRISPHSRTRFRSAAFSMMRTLV